MSNQPDPTLTRILAELAPEDHLGVLLAAQVGGTPHELQLILQTTEYLAEQDGYRPTGQYIIRALGVVEHRLALGLFSNLVISAENSMLHRYNHPQVEVYFRGVPGQVDSLMLELQQLYGQTYGIYRHLADDINRTRPLGALLSTGYGLLGTMPAPFVEKLAPLLARYGLSLHTLEAESSPPRIPYHLLVMDDSFVIAQLFSADPMGTTRKATTTGQVGQAALESK
ncbi:MAG: hypothetical protein HC915_11020 [Anaerolineae bacterium]|nr:hypothetical protein [Anaerolineae bacterium]